MSTYKIDKPSKSLIMESLKKDIITEWEYKFISGIVDSKYTTVTDKQRKWYDIIANKIGCSVSKIEFKTNNPVERIKRVPVVNDTNLIDKTFLIRNLDNISPIYGDDTILNFEEVYRNSVNNYLIWGDRFIFDECDYPDDGDERELFKSLIGDIIFAIKKRTGTIPENCFGFEESSWF